MLTDDLEYHVTFLGTKIKMKNIIGYIFNLAKKQIYQTHILLLIIWIGLLIMMINANEKKIFVFWIEKWEKKRNHETGCVENLS